MKSLFYFMLISTSLFPAKDLRELQNQVNQIAAQQAVRNDWEINCKGAGTLLLTDKSEVVMGQEVRGYFATSYIWDLFGGLIDEGETPRDCAERETEEETAGACVVDLDNDIPISTGRGVLFAKVVDNLDPDDIAYKADVERRNSMLVSPFLLDMFCPVLTNFIKNSRFITNIEKTKWGVIPLKDLIDVVEGNLNEADIKTNIGIETLDRDSIRQLVRDKVSALAPQLRQIDDLINKRN